MTDVLIKRLQKVAPVRGADLPPPAWEGGIPAPATSRQVDAEELLVGQPLHALHRRVLQEVGNGGFGPGYGLLGASPAGGDSGGESLAGLRQKTLTSEQARAPIVPLAEWGSGTWAFCDVPTGEVLSLSDLEIVRTGMTLHEWLDAWCQGEQLWKRVFVYRERTMINPFTKQLETMSFPSGLAGTAYVLTGG